MSEKAKNDRMFGDSDRSNFNISTHHSNRKSSEFQIDTQQVIEHLKALGYRPNDLVFLRFFLDKDDPRKANDRGGKANGRFSSLPWHPIKANQANGCGVYFVVNGGGHKDVDIRAGRAVFYEHDNLDKGFSASLWRELGLPEPTIQVDTGGKSVHSYWGLAEPCSVEEWRCLQSDLLEFANADRTLKNPSRVMRLAGCFHPATNQQSTIISHSAVHYTFDQMRKSIPFAQKQAPTISLPSSTATDREIERALTMIPQRVANNGNYPMYRDVLWALKAYYGEDQAVSIMEQHSPSQDCGWNVAQICRSGGERTTLGTLFHHAKQYGFEFEEKIPVRSGEQSQSKSSPLPETLEEEDMVTAEDFQAVLADVSSCPNLGFIHPFLLQPLQKRANLLNIPVECFIGAILPVAASLLKVGTRLCLALGTNWYAPPIVWAVLVGESGTSKSPVWETAIEPLSSMQAEWDIRYQSELENYQVELEQWEHHKGEEPRGPKPKPPVPRELYFQDATLEALSQSIDGHPDKGAICTVDELPQFSKGFDAYRNGRGGDRAKWLSLYDGKGLKVNRKGGNRISLQRTSISLSGGIQPEIWRKEMGDLRVIDGFWQRIIYFPLPLTKAPVPGEGGTCNLSSILNSGYRQLDQLPAQTFQLNSEARKVWNEWFEECETLKVQELHPAIRALYPKAKEQAARIALVIHCLNAVVAGKTPAEQISFDYRVDTMVIDPNSTAVWRLWSRRQPTSSQNYPLCTKV